MAPDTMTAAERPPSYVVGIGASAGGLEALERFFDNVPASTSMAFVIVQHLSPDFKSLMDELLARHTELPIELVEDGVEIEPGHVYLIPPKKEMIVSGGRLLLSERDHQQELSLPIDVFFRSLAQDCGTRAVAIVLSGGGSDGSRGIRDVHEAGGLVLVQDVESAQFDGMPRTARDAGVADRVLAPQDMPRVLLEHAAKGPRLGGGGMRPPAESDPGHDPLGPVYRMLEDEFGIDFNHYKPSTVTRRIERRIQLALASDLGEYVGRLQRERGELDLLYRDLLIGVTRFFRNEEAFAVLEERVLPGIFEREPREAPVRVWIAGCATGEEAYSLAILLHEASARYGDRPVKIFASDVHRGSLELAARASYDAEAVANVSPERLQRYFVQRGQTYQVVPEIRQLIVFAPHNVIRDAPFTRIDLISCRNLLIYLQPAAQQKALSLFHFGLARGGIMFLGPSESLGLLSHDFEVVDKHWRIYRKYSDVRTPVDARLQPHKAEPKALTPAFPPLAPRQSLAHLLGSYDALLERFMPPSLLVSDRGELLHAFGGASRFLRHRDGRQSTDALDLVESNLKLVLAGGLKRALAQTSELVFKNVRLHADGEESTCYDVGLAAIASRAQVPPSVLVSFKRSEPGPSAAASAATEIDVSSAPHAQLAALEAELNATRENLQSAIEALETGNEELQTTNEELHASNEELQSTNEELQSVNEELYSVNAEYQRKIAELTELTNDMDNLLSSTDVGTIFLNRELKVRKFTPQIGETFNLLPQDLGRSIEAFTHNIDHPELIEDLRRVLASGERVERELRDRAGRYFFLRILPYRAKGARDGVVLTLIDVSSLKTAEDALFHERYLLNSLLSAVPDAIYFKDARGRFIRANEPVALEFGLSDPRALVGKTPFELTEHRVALATHEEDENVLRTGQAQSYRLERRTGLDAGQQWVVATRHPLLDASSHPVGVITVLRDVTEQKRAEERLQEAMERRDQFLAMLSHELRNPLGAIVTATALVKRAELEPHCTKLIRIIDRQSQQMARLLDDLLEVSRVTQNKIELRKRVVDLAPIVHEAADAVRATMDARGLEFTVEVENERLCVNGDPARLQQLQVNLLNNAAKYTPRRGHVRLNARREDAAVVIRVRDDGAGIAPEMIDSVFDLFVQSERTLDRADGGLGVGLTLVRALVAMHGGSVTAHSDGTGKGSEFVVRLPLLAEPEDEAPKSRGRTKVPAGSRVVVVEDNADSREMLCELLALAGCECQAADTGIAGVELIDRVEPDVAIIDLGLPGLDGFELARRIRANPRHSSVYLIALTGYGQAADRARALHAGFDEHVVKPIGPETLVRLLRSGVEHEEGANEAAGAHLKKLN
jgi:two-component system CheB/CheR fusion protein